MHEEEIKEGKEEMYFYGIVNHIPEEVLSDEFFDRNADLISSISNSLCEINEITDGKLPEELGHKVMIAFFANLKIHGLR